MRICHVIESASGGSAAVMSDLAVHGIRRGHDVHLVYSPHRADEDLIGKLRDAGCHIQQSQMQRSVGPHDLMDGLRLRSKLRSIKGLEVVHSHSSKAGALARMFSPNRRVAQIYSPHGFYTMTGQAPAYVGMAERVLSRVTDRIVAVSREEAEHGASIGIPANKLVVIPNGIDPYAPLPRAEARKALGLSPDSFAIGFVGRFVDQKDPVSAVAVVNQITGGPVELAMIGDGDLRDVVAKDAATAKNPVHLAGAIAARPLLSAFDCLLCTSVYEGMPITFLEALNCGLPIVTYKVAGSDELVIEPDTGFVTEHAPAAAARSIETLMAMDPNQRAAINSRARDAGNHFSAERMSDTTLALYEQVLANRR